MVDKLDAHVKPKKKGISDINYLPDAKITCKSSAICEFKEQYKSLIRGGVLGVQEEKLREHILSKYNNLNLENPTRLCK